jgi:hypothetical protein
MNDHTPDLTEIFGEPIHPYTRAQAIDDGYLIDVSETAREAGFRLPVAITRSTWADCIEWTDADSKRQTYQDEAGRPAGAPLQSGHPSTRPRNSFPALKWGTRFAGTFTRSPVFGLRPIRGGL